MLLEVTLSQEMLMNMETKEMTLIIFSIRKWVIVPSFHLYKSRWSKVMMEWISIFKTIPLKLGPKVKTPL